MRRFQRYQTLKVLRQYPIPDADWRRVSDRLPLLAPLTAGERAELRTLATLFIHAKQFTGVQGMEITPEVRIAVAAQACLEILELGLDAFSGWVEIVVYPGAFRTRHQQQDAAGLVSSEERVLSGEAWDRGPVILSWDDVSRDSFDPQPGRNVVIHEFAHKLDLLNGRANGMPPLHPEMPVEAWSTALGQAYERLQRQLAHGQHTLINPYAASNPGEFFAVICEYFFTAPNLLQQESPMVYAQLKRYFRQDPLARLMAESMT
ncbi:MAG TPA: zinc-dependent peptidase [Sedimenticola sp.]|nr:zinc-dependent peptidase [Sedimenticola sp.]